MKSFTQPHTGGATAIPDVSVVVPTYHRPDAVQRAVQSALAQTFDNIEVVVVVDGRDSATLEALRRIADPRVRVLLPEHHLGNAHARNTGISEARGRWIALLDDDDLWLPQKLAVQVRTAERSCSAYPIVACRYLARNEFASLVWPRRLPRSGEPLSEYFFCRSTPFAGEGMVQTSTILTRQELFHNVPFTTGMRRYVDLDWMLRACAMKGVSLEFCAEREPLSIWNMEASRDRIGTRAEAEYTLDWARDHRHLLTRRAYAAFLLTMVSINAASCGEWRRFIPLLREAWRDGDPSAIDIATHVQYFVIPKSLRRFKAMLVQRLIGSPARASASAQSRSSADPHAARNGS